MHRLHTNISPVFTGSLQSISHLYSERSKYRISVRGPAIWNGFVEDCLRSIEKTSFFKVKMKSKLLNFDNEISYSKFPK